MKVFYKNILFLPLIFVGLKAFAQQPERLAINGTQCTMIPPAGFVASPSFSGFMHLETSSSIIIIEIPVSPDSLNGAFTKERLKGQGMNLIKMETVLYQGRSATYLTATQEAYGQTFMKQMLLFGDSSASVMVNGISPQEENTFDSSIKKALFTTRIDRKILLNAETAAPYQIDVTGTDFKYPSYSTGSLSYSTTDSVAPGKPLLIIANSLGKVFYSDEKAYAEDRVREMPGSENFTINSTIAITISDMDGYEIVAHATSKSGHPKLIYTVMLFDDDNHYFIIHGETQERLEDYLPIYKKIARSFTLKRAVY